MLARRFLSGVALALVAGCGGGGSSGTASSISIAASETTVSYGDAVSVHWSGSGISSINPDGTNFAVASSQVSGSLIDHPASDTTYRIAGDGNDGKTRSASASVHVRPSIHTLWVVGDQSQAGVPQATAQIGALSSVPVQTSLTWPTGMLATDVVIVLDSASISPADQGSVTNYLSTGGRVVFEGASPVHLATGDNNHPDLSSIGSWFAGATELSSFIRADTVATNPGFTVSTTLLSRHYNRDIFEVSPVAAAAIKLQTDGASSGAFLYKPPIGGRIAFIGGIGTGATADDQLIDGLLCAAIRWAADGA